MTHLSEERNIPGTPDAVWRIISDTKQWPRFYATPREIGKLHCVEYLDGATEDGPNVMRRLHFIGVPTWDEQVSRWQPGESIHWLGIRNPGQKYWNQQLEIIPGRGYVTLRWDLFYELSGGGRAVKKAFKRTLEDIMLSSLERVERLVKDAAKA